MDAEEAIELSESLSRYQNDVLSKVTTDWYILICKNLTRTGVTQLLEQLNGTDGGRAVYWRECQKNYKRFHKIIIRDAQTATLATLFAGEQQLKKMTLGEVRDARNHMDIPWLPPSKGYLDVQQYNAWRRDIISNIYIGEYWLEEKGYTEILGALRALKALLHKTV